jgi:hypothetical protein
MEPLRASVTTTDEGTSPAGDHHGRGRGEPPPDPWRLMSELLAADRMAAKKSIDRPPVQIATFEA